MEPRRNSIARLRFSLTLAALLGAGTSGCIVIPTPEFNSGNARANINKQTAARFEPGQTTRADVILALGEPDAVSPDERQLAYRSEKICGFWFVGAYYTGAGGTIPRDRYLVFHFDAQDRLEKADRSAPWTGSAAVGKVLSGAGASHPGTTEEPVCQQHPGQWYPQLNGFKDKNWEQVPCFPGQLLLTPSNLVFVSQARFANAPPALTTPYDSLRDCRVDDYFLGRRLVIQTRSGESHTFSLLKRIGGGLDKVATSAACDFIQARIPREPLPAAQPQAVQNR